MRNQYADLSTEDFDRILVDILCGMSAEQIIAIPGVYEVLSEYLNNEVLDQWREEREADQ